MAFAEHLPAYFTDFGLDAVVGGVAVRGIFDADYGDPMGLVAGARTVLTVASGDVGAVLTGAAVTANSTAYTVAEIQPDGTGITRLVLERV